MKHLGNGLVLLFALGPLAAAAKSQKAHEHGAVTVSVAVEGTEARIEAEIPGDDLFGFEHAPRTASEKSALSSALSTLRGRPLEMFTLPPTAGCSAKAVSVTSGLEGQSGGKETKLGDHQDVDLAYTFTCKQPLSGLTLTVGLFKAFPRIKTIRLQVLTASQQTGVVLHGATEGVKL